MSAFYLPVTPLDLARGTTFLIGMVGVGVGASALLNPSAFAANFGFPPQSLEASTATSNAFVPIAAGRALGSGLGLLALVYLKLNKAVGVCLIAGTATAFTDGYLLNRSIDALEDSKISDEERKAAKAKAWGHWGVMPVIGGIGTWLVMNS